MGGGAGMAGAEGREKAMVDLQYQSLRKCANVVTGPKKEVVAR